jgi:hypothetical protein
LDRPGLDADRSVFRHQEINAVRLAIDMRVDPGQLGFELPRRIGGRTKHPETAGATDGGYHIAAMAEASRGNSIPSMWQSLVFIRGRFLPGRCTEEGGHGGDQIDGSLRSSQLVGIVEQTPSRQGGAAGGGLPSK